MAGVVASIDSGTASFGLHFRTFKGDPDVPSAWNGTALWSPSSITGLDNDLNSGLLAVTPGANLFGQAGIALTTTDIVGHLDIILADVYG